MNKQVQVPEETTAADRIEERAERIKQATTSAVTHTKEAVDRAADKVEEGLHRATDKAGELRDRGAELASRARDRADDAMDNVRDFVREKPVQSVAIALAAGWLLGRLLGPRR